MNGVRVYMKASWSRPQLSGNEASEVTVLEYKDAHYELRSVERLVIFRDQDEIAIFPPGSWAGVERF